MLWDLAPKHSWGEVLQQQRPVLVLPEPQKTDLYNPAPATTVPGNRRPWYRPALARQGACSCVYHDLSKRSESLTSGVGGLLPVPFLSTLVKPRGNSSSFVSASSGHLLSFFTPFSKTPSTILVVDEKKGHILNLTSTGEACEVGGLTNSETYSNHTAWSEMKTS